MRFDRRSTWLWAALIGLAIVCTYGHTLNGPFIFDDLPELAFNLDAQTFRGCLDTIWASQNTGLSGRPFACLTFAANFALHGNDVRGFHLVNIAIHFLSAVAILLIIRNTLTHASTAPAPITAIAGAIALLFAVHPLQTESVTYIIQRIESLAGLLFLLAMLSASFAWRNPKIRKSAWSVLAILSCAAGMLTKEIVAVAPLVIYLYDVVFFSRSWTAPLRNRPVFYAALATTILIPILLISNSPRSGTIGFGLGVSALDYLRTQTHVLLYYLRLVFWPFPQSISYSDWAIVRTWPPALLPGLIIVIFFAATIFGLSRRRWWGFCGIWCFLILAPSSSFVPIVTEPAAERRMYLPLAGVLALIVGGVAWLGPHLVSNLKTRRAVFAILIGCSTVALGGRTIARNSQYASSIGILLNDLNVRPGDELLRGALVEELLAEGQMDDAVRVHHEGLTRNPASWILYDNWGRAMSARGRPAEAVEAFDRAIELRPDHAPSLAGLGLSYIQLGRPNDAVVALERARQLTPVSYSIRSNLAIAYANLGRSQEAIHELRAAVEIKPNFADGHYNLARYLAAAGDTQSAIHHLQIAARLKPQDADIRKFLEDLRRRLSASPP